MRNRSPKISKIFFLPVFLVIITPACRENLSKNNNSITRLTVSTTTPNLGFTNGSLYYNNKPFTGATEEKYPNGQLQSHAEYLNGKENGFTTTYYDNGEKLSERYYTNGMKDSIATGWWPGGIKKFEYHFKNDVYNGAFSEYYTTGQPAQEIMYDHGKELSGKGWRENGKLYMNFVWKGNRRYGLVNPNMCYGIAKGAVKE